VNFFTNLYAEIKLCLDPNTFKMSVNKSRQCYFKY